MRSHLLTSTCTRFVFGKGFVVQPLAPMIQPYPVEEFAYRVSNDVVDKPPKIGVSLPLSCFHIAHLINV